MISDSIAASLDPPGSKNVVATQPKYTAAPRRGGGSFVVRVEKTKHHTLETQRKGEQYALTAAFATKTHLAPRLGQLDSPQSAGGGLKSTAGSNPRLMFFASILASVRAPVSTLRESLREAAGVCSTWSYL